jgi:uncharacterized protein
MPGFPLSLLLLAAVTVDSVPNPRAAGSWVSDTANLLPIATERRMDERLDALNRDLGVEIAVVTASDIDSTPKDFANRLFAHWGIGKARADNGLLVLLVADQRRLEMETGYGLEAILPDGWLGGMQAEVMVPAFRSGDFPGGLEAGLARIDQRLRQRPEEAREGTRRDPADLPERAQGVAGSLRSNPAVLPGLGGAAALGLAGGMGLLVRARRRRQRTCPKDKIEMRLLDEVEDDAHLDAGQRTEESIGSVDYRVYICRQCQFSRTVAKKRWFSGFSRCRQCHYRALRSVTETLVHATYDYGGQVRVTETCHHCPFTRTYIRHTARLTRPTTSSSSGGGFSSRSGGGGFSSRSGGGGSSFGGGSSGGGGAGSSW